MSVNNPFNMNIVTPSLDELMPKVDSRYTLVTLAAKRTRQMLDEAGNVQTAHSTNVVPMILIGEEGKNLTEEGKLADIAPTLLELLGLEKPDAMTGTSMLK